MLATPFNVNGVGRIIEIGDINDVGNTRTVSAKLESERRRMRGAEQIVETDQFYVQFWDSGANVFSDGAKVGDSIHFNGELRNRKGMISLKINKFEVYPRED